MKNIRGLGLICATLLSASFPSHAQTYVEAYGDSLTAGFLSNTDVTNAPPLKELSGLISDLAMYLMTKNRAHIAKHHSPHFAWVSVLSKKLDPTGPVTLDNHAVSAARSAQILGQVRSHTNRHQPSSAFFFAGHNDLCNNNAPPTQIGLTYRAEMNQAIAAWDSTHENSTAYLVPVSDIHRVYAALKGYVWHNGGQSKYACEDSWSKFFPYCPSHLARFKAGLLDDYMKPRLAAMNAGLEDLAHDWNKKSSTNKFVYLKGAHDVPYEPQYFAVDCFHLSEAGQKSLANRLEQLINTP